MVPCASTDGGACPCRGRSCPFRVRQGSPRSTGPSVVAFESTRSLAHGRLTGIQSKGGMGERPNPTEGEHMSALAGANHSGTNSNGCSSTVAQDRRADSESERNHAAGPLQEPAAVLALRPAHRARQGEHRPWRHLQRPPQRTGMCRLRGPRQLGPDLPPRRRHPGKPGLRLGSMATAPVRVRSMTGAHGGPPAGPPRLLVL